MRIIHVITSLRTGGAEKLMVDLLPRLRDKGNDVELVVFDGIKTPFYEQLEADGIKVIPLREGKSVYNPLNIIALRKLMKNCDIIHTHNTSPQLFAAIANVTLFGKRPLLVTTEHNTTNRRRSIPFMKPIDKWMYSKYARIICISKQAYVNLREYLNELIVENVLTIYNGVDTSRFMRNNCQVSSSEGRVLVTMVAAFRKQKDQKTLIRAISLLPDRFSLQLIGTGDVSLISSCKALAEEMGISARVHFMGMRTDVPELLSSSDIVVLSSHYEGLSLSSIEGMASGRPFIASDVDGLHEIVDGYGLLFEHENHKQLAELIMEVADNHQLAQKIADRCKSRAMQYDIQFMVDNYHAVYKELVL